MRPDHERIEELLAAQVLGGIDTADARTLRAEMATHGDACAECRRLERELTEVAGLLPLVLDPAPVDPAVAERILATDRGHDTAAPTEATPGPADELAERRRRAALPDEGRRRGRIWSVVAAAVAAAIAIVTAATVLRSPVEVTRADLAGRVVRLDAGSAGDVDLAMAYTPGEPGVVVWGRLPDPGDGKVYEIWMIAGDTPTSAGCARPVDGRIALFVDRDLASADTMAVTVEPTDCPAQPTGPIVASAPLPTA